MEALYLIACSGVKLRGPLVASELYQGKLFQYSKAYCELHGYPWAILSGKYGLVTHDQVIDHYDLNLRHQSAQFRKEWAAMVKEQLHDYPGWPCRLKFLAGRAYTQYLPDGRDLLKDNPIGKRLGLLKWAVETGNRLPLDQ